MTRLHACIVSTELGEFVLAWAPESFPRVRRIHLPATAAEMRRLLASYELDGERTPPLAGLLRRYAAGENVRFAWSDLDLAGVPDFHARVYRALFALRRGRVIGYGGLARAAGRPAAARAVGQAMANNPVPIAVPCHRVVRAGGHLGGFGGGLDLKRRLLRLEGVQLADEMHVDPAALE